MELAEAEHVRQECKKQHDALALEVEPYRSLMNAARDKLRQLMRLRNPSRRERDERSITHKTIANARAEIYKIEAGRLGKMFDPFYPIGIRGDLTYKITPIEEDPRATLTQAEILKRRSELFGSLTELDDEEGD